VDTSEKLSERDTSISADELYRRAFDLWQAGRVPEAVAIYDELVTKYEAFTDPHVCVLVAYSLNAKASALRLAGSPESAIEIYGQLIARFEESAHGELGSEVAEALEQSAFLLVGLDRPGEALTTYEDLLARFGDSVGAPTIEGRIARALSARASLVSRTDETGPALEASEKLVALALRADGDEVLTVVARELVNVGGILFAQACWEEALVVFGRVAELFANSNQPQVREQVVLALANNVEALAQLGRIDEAEAAHEQMLAAFGDDAVDAFHEAAARWATRTDPRSREQRAAALFKKASALAALGRLSEADAAFTDVVSSFADDEAVGVRRVVAAARASQPGGGAAE
jgi:tetratricopeptide (TPR) repeat protein